jgi:hypothetical protein
MKLTIVMVITTLICVSTKCRPMPDNADPIYLRRNYLVTAFWILLLGAAAGIWDMSLGDPP